jgi:hypothetical protein
MPHLATQRQKQLKMRQCRQQRLRNRRGQDGQSRQALKIRPPARLLQVLAKPDAAIEGIGSTQKQQTIGLLTILAEAAESSVEVALGKISQ